MMNAAVLPGLEIITPAAPVALPAAAPVPTYDLDKIRASIREGRLMVGPNLAEAVLAHMNFPDQRVIMKFQVDRLAAMMLEGKWQPGSQIAFVRLPDGSMLLVNGQHRMRAVVQTRMPIECQVLVIPVADIAEARVVYYRFDTVQSLRTARQVARSIGLSEHLSIPKGYVAAALQVAPILASGLRNLQGSLRDPILATPDGQIAAIAPYWGEVKRYSEFTGDTDFIRRKLKVTGTMAVALMTLKYQPEKAATFWSGVATDDGLGRRDPRKVLLRDWATRKEVTGNIAICVAARAWNAWFEQREIQHIRATHLGDVSLLGTPIMSSSPEYDEDE